MGLGEDVGGLGHEVDAAEDDELGFGLLGGPLGELEGVAAEVGELDDVLALVVVAEDDAAGAEPLAGGGDAGDDLGRVQAPVLLRDVLLPEGEGALLGEGAGLQGAVGGALHRLIEEGVIGDEREGFCDLRPEGHGDDLSSGHLVYAVHYPAWHKGSRLGRWCQGDTKVLGRA